MHTQLIYRNYRRINYKIKKVCSSVGKLFSKPDISEMFYTVGAVTQSNMEDSKSDERNQGKHIEITSQSYRNSAISEAIVTDIYPLSTSVKGFNLRILDPKLTFQAGQWVDAFIPSIDQVGGFSICSSPSQLQEKGLIFLGIKKSSWPPANWFYEKCRPGTKISLRIGGDFFYPRNESDISCDLLLVAGGVGVNPIFSIYSHNSWLRTQSKEGLLPGRVSFLFSARSQHELLYKSTIDAVATTYPKYVSLQYFATRDSSADTRIKSRRILFEDVCRSLGSLDKSKTKAYICGPPAMIEAVEQHILDCNLPKSRIYYEKWW